MSYSLYRFGTSEILPVAGSRFDIGTGKAKVESVDFPHGGAYDQFGNDQTYRGGFELEYSCIISGSSSADLANQYDTLRSYLGKKDKLYRKVDGSTDLQWVWARLIDIKCVRESININHLELDLVFFVFSPLWSGDLHGSWRLDSGEVLDTVDLVFDTGIIYPLTTTSASFTIVNGGNAKLHSFDFSISSGSTTPITEIRVEKAGETDFTWTGEIATNSQLVIDFGSLSIRNSGVDAYSGFELSSANHKIDSWGVLNPGNNIFTVTRTGGDINSSISVTYYDGYV